MNSMLIYVLCALLSILSYVGLCYSNRMIAKNESPFYTILGLSCVFGTLFPIGYLGSSVLSDITKETTTTIETVSEETVSNEITAEDSSVEETIVEETQETTKSAEEDPVIIKYQRYAYTEYLNDMEPGDLLELDIADRSQLLVGTDTETAETFWNTETSEYKDFYEIYYSELD